MVQKNTFLAILLTIVGSIQQVQAQQTHVVDLSGTGDFTTIHAAVAAASSGDTIRVNPEQYVFTSSLGAIEINKPLVIIGSGYMPVAEGGTELIDIAGTGFFDLTGSADGTVIRGFRIQGGTGFLDTQSGTSGVVVEENLFIGGSSIIQSLGSQDIIRNNIFVSAYFAINISGSNTTVTNNIFTNGSGAAVWLQGTTGNLVTYNLILKGSYGNYAIGIQSGNPEVYSNGFVSCYASITGTGYITNNGFYGVGEAGLNAVTSNPGFVGFDVVNESLELEDIDEGEYDLRLAEGSGWIDTGRTGIDYLDRDGTRSDIGAFAGPNPFKDGKGTPTVPVVIDIQIIPATVSPSGTITIKATGRIGS